MTNDSIEIISSDYGSNVKILINGEPLTCVRSAEIHFNPCETPVVIFELIPRDLRISSDAEVIINDN